MHSRRVDEGGSPVAPGSRMGGQEATRSLAVESDWLPPAELERLLEERRPEFETVVVRAEDPAHRGLDPTLAVAIVNCATNLLVPFVSALVDRLFKSEPDAAVALGGNDDTTSVVVRASLPADERQTVIAEAIASGAGRVRITLDVSAE
jgi:hypothetical protein